MSRKGENCRKYSERMCVAKRASRYARHKGEKGDDFPDVRPSELKELRFAENPIKIGHVITKL